MSSRGDTFEGPRFGAAPSASAQRAGGASVCDATATCGEPSAADCAAAAAHDEATARGEASVCGEAATCDGPSADGVLRGDVFWMDGGLRLHGEVWKPALSAARRVAPLLLVHGFAQSARSWAATAERLAASGRVTYAIDLTGHGQSDRPCDEQAYELGEQGRTLLGCARRVARAEGARPTIVGYSMGGRVALAALVDGPEAFSEVAGALVLESCGLGPADEAERARAAQADARRAEEMRAQGLEAFMEAWGSQPLFASQVALPSDVRGRVRAERLANDVEALVRTFERAGQHAMPARGAVCAALAGYVERGGRVRYVAGALDEKYAALAEVLPSCVEARIVECAGHNVHLERPDAYAQLLCDFIA